MFIHCSKPLKTPSSSPLGLVSPDLRPWMTETLGAATLIDDVHHVR